MWFRRCSQKPKDPSFFFQVFFSCFFFQGLTIKAETSLWLSDILIPICLEVFLKTDLVFRLWGNVREQHLNWSRLQPSSGIFHLKNPCLASLASKVPDGHRNRAPNNSQALASFFNISASEEREIFCEIRINLPETNIALENRPLEKEIPIGNHHF